MSLYDYKRSAEIVQEPFYTLIMAAFRKADTENLRKLSSAFPEVWAELKARYNAPGGRLPEESRPDA